MQDCQPACWLGHSFLQMWKQRSKRKGLIKCPHLNLCFKRFAHTVRVMIFVVSDRRDPFLLCALYLRYCWQPRQNISFRSKFVLHLVRVIVFCCQVTAAQLHFSFAHCKCSNHAFCWQPRQIIFRSEIPSRSSFCTSVRFMLCLILSFSLFFTLYMLTLYCVSRRQNVMKKKEVKPVTWPMQVHYFYTMKKHIKKPKKSRWLWSTVGGVSLPSVRLECVCMCVCVRARVCYKDEIEGQSDRPQNLLQQGERPTIFDSHSEVSKDFIDQKARRKRCTKTLNPIVPAVC